jgi:hypothetical protein
METLGQLRAAVAPRWEVSCFGGKQFLAARPVAGSGYLKLREQLSAGETVASLAAEIRAFETTSKNGGLEPIQRLRWNRTDDRRKTHAAKAGIVELNRLPCQPKTQNWPLPRALPAGAGAALRHYIGGSLADAPFRQPGAL